MMDILSIVALAIITLFISLFIKQYKPEFSALITVCSSVIILSIVAEKLEPLLNTYIGIAESSNINSSLFTIMVKAVGISYLTTFTSEICRDFGQSSLAGKVELFGKITLLVIASPMILKIIDVAGELM